MVDIHSHIFWGVDDGADTRETTLAMLRVASDSGTTDIVGTPHANAESVPDPEVINRQMEDLNRALDGKPRIHRGCELHVSFDAIQDALANPRKYTVNGKNFLLLEFAGQLPPHAEDLLARLADAGMDPIIAHAERNPTLAQKVDQLEKWCERGVLVQITAKSLEGGFGAKAADAAWRMLSRGLVHFVASDAHDLEHRQRFRVEKVLQAHAEHHRDAQQCRQGGMHHIPLQFRKQGRRKPRVPAQFQQSHAFAQPQPPQFVPNPVFLEPLGDGFRCHCENRFPLTACSGRFLSAREKQLSVILYSKTVFL